MGTELNGRASVEARNGIIYGLAAYGFWGLMPLYFDAVRNVPAGEILAQRIVWCGALLLVLLSFMGRWRELADRWRQPGVPRTFLLTSLLLSINWLVYIYGVTTRQIVETSLGYFINPLVSILLGMAIFRERLRLGQAIAVLMALAGVAFIVASAGRFPWIAMTLAVSFGLYGMFRKKAPVDALLGLALETFILVPLALAYLVVLVWQKTMSFGRFGLTTDVLLLASGVVTALPLFWFGQAARLLRLSTLGFLQYLAPTIQLVLAIVLLGESVAPVKWVSFALIWTALAVYSIDSWRHLNSTRTMIIADGDGGAELEPLSRTDSDA